MSNNLRGDGSISNSYVGRDFEDRARKALSECGLRLTPDHKVPCGLGAVQKNHSFDLGSEDPRVIVGCKSHAWTSGGNVPSAKMKNWAEAMFYFHLAQGDYSKIFLVERRERRGGGERLLSYLILTETQMIPTDVECWELDGDELVVHEVPA